MSIAIKVLFTTTLVFSFAAVANADEKGLMKEDAQVINAAIEDYREMIGKLAAGSAGAASR